MSGHTADSHSTLEWGQCFRFDEASARLASSVGWSPHNVLQLCTRWTVSLYCASLSQPALQLFPTRHPLVYRPGQTTLEVVIGATWAPQLSAEGLYPATARLCVRTTANVIVYRVSRRGTTSLGASRGIGIALAWDAPEGAAPPVVPSEADGRPVVTRMGRAKAGASKETKPPPAKRGGCRGPARGKKKKRAASDSSASSWSSSSSSSRSSSSSSSDNDDDSPLRGRVRAKTETEGSESTSSPPPPARVRHTVVDALWLTHDVLAVVTTEGVYTMNFYGSLEDEYEPVVRQLPATPAYRFDQDAAAAGAPYAVCVVQDDSTTASLATPLLLVASATAVRVLRVLVGDPRVVAEMPAHLQLCVDLPMLQSVPSAMAAVRGAGDEEISVFVSAPSGTFRGSFPVAAVRQFPGNPKPNVVALTPRATYETSHDVCLRGFTVLSLRSLRAPPVDGAPPLALPPQEVTNGVVKSETPSSSSGTGAAATPFAPAAAAAAADVVSHVVLGVGRRGLYFMHLRNSTSEPLGGAPLLSCPLLVGRRQMPSGAAAAVSGVALHPSGAMALMAVDVGRPMVAVGLLVPVRATDPQGFLHRVLEVSGVYVGVSEDPEVEAARQSALGHSVQSDLTDAPLGIAERAAHMNREYLCGRELWMRQRDPSAMLWERLFPECEATGLMGRYAEVRRRLFSATTSGPNLPTDRALRVAVTRLRDAYLRQRAANGVALYLRWPLPALATGEIPSGKAQDGEWWSVLLHLLRRCPYDVATIVRELVLSQALRVLAAKAKYANTSSKSDEVFRSDQEGCATSTAVLSFEGALAFLLTYVETHTAELEAAAAPSERGSKVWASWTASAEWCATLRHFVSNASAKAEVTAQTRFPCSICDAPASTAMALSLFGTSKHVPAGAAPGAPEEEHTTFFSGMTFSPLSILSQESVLVSCLQCLCCDFARGPVCAICGGIQN